MVVIIDPSDRCGWAKCAYCLWIEMNVHFTTTSQLQCLFRRFLQLSSKLQIRCEPAGWPTVGSNRESEQKVRNCLRERHLSACRPHWGLDLPAVCRHSRHEWVSPFERVRLFRVLSLWTNAGVHCSGACGRQRVAVWASRLLMPMANSLALGGGGGISYQRTCFSSLCTLNEKRYCDGSSWEDHVERVRTTFLEA